MSCVFRRGIAALCPRLAEGQRRGHETVKIAIKYTGGVGGLMAATLALGKSGTKRGDPAPEDA